MLQKRKYAVFIAVFLASLAFDQGTKIWARASLKPRPTPIVVVEDFFEFRYSENTGSAFGLFRNMPNARYVLFGFGVIALGVIFFYLKRVPGDRTRLITELGLLAGGAVGNIIDRVSFGRVTDFILWKVHSHEWPTFNIADAALVVGVIGLLFDADPKTVGGEAADASPGGSGLPEPSKKA